MLYTIYVHRPHRQLRNKCKITSDGRHVLFEGEGLRRDIMEMAREAANQADSVHVIWKTERAFQKNWRQPSLVAVRSR